MSKKSRNKNRHLKQTRQPPKQKVKSVSVTIDNMSVDNLDYIEAKINYKNLGFS